MMLTTIMPQSVMVEGMIRQAQEYMSGLKKKHLQFSIHN